MFSKACLLGLLVILSSCGTNEPHVKAYEETLDCMESSEGFPVKNCLKVLEGK